MPSDEHVARDKWLRAALDAHPEIAARLKDAPLAEAIAAYEDAIENEDTSGEVRDAHYAVVWFRARKGEPAAVEWILRPVDDGDEVPEGEIV